MDSKDLIQELNIKIEALILAYEHKFISSSGDVEGFLSDQYPGFRSELAQLATNTIHQAIINGIGGDQTLIFTIQRLNIEGVYKLLERLNSKRI